jgi:hypothetical protein
MLLPYVVFDRDAARLRLYQSGGLIEAEWATFFVIQPDCRWPPFSATVEGSAHFRHPGL